MKYLVVDGELSGTGLRNKYDREYGYIDPRDINLSDSLVSQIEKWQKAYEQVHFYGYKDKKEILRLDTEGIQIARKIASELTDVKVEYFSDAELKTLFMISDK